MLRSASWVAFADADVLLQSSCQAPPRLMLQATQLKTPESCQRARRRGPPALHLQPDIASWLTDASSALWTAKEITYGKLDLLPSGWFYEAPNKRNQPTNSNRSTHLLIAKPHAAPVLSYWYCLAEQECDELHGGAGCYRVDWSHEQYLLDYLPGLGVNIGLPQSWEDYNGVGKLVRHLFWKNANDASIVTADVRMSTLEQSRRSPTTDRDMFFLRNHKLLARQNASAPLVA